MNQVGKKGKEGVVAFGGGTKVEETATIGERTEK